MIDVGPGAEVSREHELRMQGIEYPMGLALRDWKEWVRMHMMQMIEKKRSQLSADLHRLKQRHYLFVRNKVKERWGTWFNREARAVAKMQQLVKGWIIRSKKKMKARKEAAAAAAAAAASPTS